MSTLLVLLFASSCEADPIMIRQALLHDLSAWVVLIGVILATVLVVFKNSRRRKLRGIYRKLK